MTSRTTQHLSLCFVLLIVLIRLSTTGWLKTSVHSACPATGGPPNAPRGETEKFKHFRTLAASATKSCPVRFSVSAATIYSLRARASYRSLFHFLERSGRQWNNPPRRWHVTRFNGQRLVRRFKGPTSCAKEKPLRETDGNVCGNHLCVTSMAECDEGSLKSLICVLKGPPFQLFPCKGFPQEPAASNRRFCWPPPSKEENKTRGNPRTRGVASPPSLRRSI